MQLIQLRKNSLKKKNNQACRDSNPDLCDTGERSNQFIKLVRNITGQNEDEIKNI